MPEVAAIGVVEREAVERVPPKELRDEESTIVVDPEYEAGLHRIEENDHVVVVFHLHLSTDYELRGDRLYGSERGVFACRSPNRPGRIGVTTVELLGRDGRRLRVRGLDAVDGTPVVDLKPYAPGLDSPRSVDPSTLDADPRSDVDAVVRRRDVESLLVDAAALHGRYCPMLAAGVLAAGYAARDLGGRSTRGLAAGVESSGCLADAAQHVLGATTGNGRLHRRDTGTRALTAVTPDGRALRIEFADDQLRSALGLDDLACRCGEGADIDEGTRAAVVDLLERPLSDVASLETDVDRPAWIPVVD